MKLTGKAKENFQKYLEGYFGNGKTIWTYKEFRKFPFCMQFGLFVDFFSDNKIVIDINFYPEKELHDYTIWHFNNGWWEHFGDKDYLNHSETRTAAIEKANEIYNKLEQM